MNSKNVQNLTLILKLISDIFIVAVSFLIGYELKFKLFLHFSPIENYDNIYIDIYLEVLWILVLIWILSFIIVGLYKRWEGTLAWEKEVSAIFKGVLVAVLQTLAFTFIFTSLPQSRYVIVYAGMSSFVLLFISRGIINKLEKYLIRKVRGNINSLVIGAGPIGQEIAEKMLLYPSLGYNYMGSLVKKFPDKINYHLKDKFKILGKPADYKNKDLIKDKEIRAIFLSKHLNELEQEELITFCDKNNIILKMTPSRGQLNRSVINFNEMDGIPIMNIQHPKFSKNKTFIKRVFDLAISVPFLLISLPIMAVIALLIKRDSQGPIIYKQKRMGRIPARFFDNMSSYNNRQLGKNVGNIKHNNFWIYKFRTMVPNAEKDTGPTLTNSDGDSKITNIGSFLRKTSLDELPQLFNVIKGDMSLIGPRPERPYFHKKYAEEIPEWNYRLIVKGGMSGWAQVNGRAKLSTVPIEKLAYDMFYINNWSIFFDLKIICRTITNVVLQKNVY